MPAAGFSIQILPGGSLRLRLKHGFAVDGDTNDVGVRTFDGHDALIGRRFDGGFNEDFRSDPGKTDADFPFVDQFLRLFVVFRRYVCQGLQPLVAVSGNHAQRSSEDISYFIGIGNAAGKSVFVHSGVHGNQNALDRAVGIAACFCGSKGNSAGFRNAKRRFHVLFNQL